MLLKALLLNVCSQGTSTISLGSLFQCWTSLTIQKGFLTPSLTLPGRALCHFDSAISSQEQSPAPPRLPFLRELHRALRLPLGLLQIRQHESSQAMPSSPFIGFVDPLWKNSSILTSFLCCGAQSRIQHSR